MKIDLYTKIVLTVIAVCLGWIVLCDLPILERGIRVTNGLGNFDLPIAEWNVMMMLMWQRNMLTQLENQKNATWDRAAEFQSDLFGRNLNRLLWYFVPCATKTIQLIAIQCPSFSRNAITNID